MDVKVLNQLFKGCGISIIMQLDKETGLFTDLIGNLRREVQKPHRDLQIRCFCH